jgi:transposase-like protein
MIEVQIPPELDRLSEHDAALLLAHQRWGTRNPSDPPRCPVCGRPLWHSPTQPRRFGCSSCHWSNSVTAGTLLHRCRLPLWKVLVMAFNLVQRHRPSTRALALALGLHVETAWQWRQRFLFAVAEKAGFVHGALQHVRCKIMLRPPPPRAVPLPPYVSEHLARQCMFRGWLGVTFLKGPSGPIGALIARDPHRALALHCDAEPPVLLMPCVDPPMAWAAKLFTVQVNRIFLGLGARWLHRYATLAAHLDDVNTNSLMRAALHSEVHCFDELRPGTDPHLDHQTALAVVHPMLGHRRRDAHTLPEALFIC